MREREGGIKGERRKGVGWGKRERGRGRERRGEIM